ncbi:MAG TPA: ABC transporter ATP-binding protein [Pseudonocardiaceae bacterium]|nr:ABC transporter ATP-binding protein [Pseudonocardiaceae bacterium]
MAQPSQRPDSQWRLPVADGRTVRRIVAELVRTDRRAVALVVALNSLAAAAGVAGPWLLGSIVNEVGPGAQLSSIDRLAALIVGFAVLQLVLTRYARYVGYRFGERTLSTLRIDFIGRALALPTSVVERAGTGDLMTRSSADVIVIGNMLREAGPAVMSAVLQVVFIFVATFVVSPLLGLCSFAALPLFIAGTRWYLHRARAAYLAEGDANSDLSETLAATAEGGRTVDAFRLQQRRIDAGERAMQVGFATRLRTLWLRSRWFPTIDFGHMLPIAAILIAGGIGYLHGVFMLGVVASASLYMWQLADPIDEVLMWTEYLQRGTASFARVAGLAQLPPPPPPSEEIPVDDRIEVHGVHYAYHDEHDVLHDVNLAVRPGERLAVVGPSGAGKSTLGRLLAGIDAPKAGRITVGGVPVVELSAEELRRRIILVTQEHHVFLGTLRDNLAMAAPDASDDALRSALDTVDAQWARELPGGLDTVLGNTDEDLDPARAQQLALARVVLADPHTVVLDEATSLLDPTTARHAERAMGAVLAGRTVIAIAHRLHTAHDADRVAVIDEGRLTELGSHDQLLEADGSYAALWRSWHGIPAQR